MDTIEKFSSYLINELNRSVLTAEAYKRDLLQFASWLTAGKTESFSPSDVTVTDVRGWLSAVSSAGDSAVTLRRKTQSLRSFFRYLMKMGITDSNPADDITLAKKPRRLPAFVKEGEMEEILGREPSDFKGIRDHLVLDILYTCGIRQAELLALKDSDINLHSCEAVVTGKGNKQRLIPLPRALVEEIAEWQRIRNTRHGITADANTHLFESRNGNLSKATLYNIVKRNLSGAAAERKSPHILRHTFATAMLNDGASLDTVKEMLGHSSMASTQIYTHVSFAQLKRNYDTSHPRANKKTDPGKDDFS